MTEFQEAVRRALIERMTGPTSVSNAQRFAEIVAVGVANAIDVAYQHGVGFGESIVENPRAWADAKEAALHLIRSDL